MPKKPKHPKDMTTEEAMAHLFHPKVVKAAREEARRAEKPQVRSTKDHDKE